MAISIMLDAGHGGEDPGAVYQNRSEKDDNLALVKELGQILSNNGIDVQYTRTTDIYQTPFEKAQLANNAGVDYFISIHRNSAPTPNQYHGVETLVYDKSGIKLEMAENINNRLSEVGFENLGVKARPGLVVLRRTNMPALLVEVGFLNSDVDNEIFDKNQRQIAQAIADGILETLQMQPADVNSDAAPLPQLQDEMDPGSPLYRVQVGLFRKRSNADQLLYELLERDYPAFMLAEDGYFKVQVGAFRQLGNAIAMERRLRRAGYATLITT